MKPKIEYKQFPFEIKAVDVEDGTFSGYAAIFNVPDDGHPPDIILPGAFAKTIQEWGPGGSDRITVLSKHNSYELPIGKPIELAEDDHGLRFVARISKTTRGLETLTLLRDHVLKEMSIGFDVIKADPGQGVRYLREVRLWEISPVTWAMHPQALVTSVKSIRPVADRDLDPLSLTLALSAEQPDPSTAPDAAASSPFDPDCLQSIKALTAQVLAATSTRRRSCQKY